MHVDRIAADRDGRARTHPRHSSRTPKGSFGTLALALATLLTASAGTACLRVDDAGLRCPGGAKGPT